MSPYFWLLVFGGGAVVATVAVVVTRHSRASGTGSAPPAAADPVQVAAAAPAMPLEHRMKPYDGLRDCRVCFDGHALRWSLRAASKMVRLTIGFGEIPLVHIAGIRIVEIQQGAEPWLHSVRVPPGPAVAVATPQGEACFAVEDPPLFAAQLDARLRALGLPAWQR